jgi:hypothetical protein
MRRFIQVTAVIMTAGLASACGLDKVIETEAIPTAGVRFINAVPDTNAMDMRFVDFVESNAHFGIAFRANPVTTGGVPTSQQVQYKNTRAGSRHMRIFLSDTLQSVATFVLKDTMVNFEAGKLYTVMMWGNAKSGAPGMRLTVMQDAPPDPGTNIALRVINTTGSAIDVRHYLSTGTAPATATWANVAPLSASNYITAPTGTYRFNVRAAGGTTDMFTDATALIGAAKTIDIEALPGTTQAGSAVTAIVYPRSVAGTKAPQTAAFAAPAITFVWDRRPPR